MRRGPTASAPPLGRRARAGRRRALRLPARSQAAAGRGWRLTCGDCEKDGAAEGGKVQHRRSGKRAARLGAPAPWRAALPLRSLGVHGVQGESWRCLRPLPSRVRTERARPPESVSAGSAVLGGCVCGGEPAPGLHLAGAAQVLSPAPSSRAAPGGSWRLADSARPPWGCRAGGRGCPRLSPAAV